MESTGAPGTSESWDVVVIGGGPAGENAAQYAIQGSGRRAAIVEAELVGGECSYWACMPSKALLRPIELTSAARAMPGVAQMLSGPLDVGAVLARRDDFTHHHDDSGQVGWANGVGIDVIRGRGRLSGEKTVEVTAADGSVRTIRAGHALVGAEVAELLHSATTAIVGKVTLETLWHVVPSYPTASEVWLRLLEARRA